MEGPKPGTVRLVLAVLIIVALVLGAGLSGSRWWLAVPVLLGAGLFAYGLVTDDPSARADTVGAVGWAYLVAVYTAIGVGSCAAGLGLRQLVRRVADGARA